MGLKDRRVPNHVREQTRCAIHLVRLLNSLGMLSLDPAAVKHALVVCVKGRNLGDADGMPIPG